LGVAGKAKKRGVMHQSSGVIGSIACPH
jgi:hypothetical protein